MAGRVRVYERVRGDPGDRCLLVEDGVPCSGYVKVRGLCLRHYTRSLHDRRIQAFALAPLLPSERKREIRLKEKPECGICRVIDDGEPCPVPARQRGLCMRHYHRAHQRGVLEEFALPRPGPSRFARRRRPQEGMCLVREDGRDCSRPATHRGLCKQHYSRLLERHPEILQRIALPARGSAVLTLRERTPAGRCRLLENGRGCPGRAEVRGVCQHHYNVLRSRKNRALFERLASPPRRKQERVFTRRPDAGADRRFCTVIENGVPCPAPPEQRGVCREHRRALGNHPAYSLEDFYLPRPEVVLRRKAPAETGDGLCLAMADDVPCRERPFARGLCRRHHRMANDRGTLDELGLPPRARLAGPGRQFGARNEIPHFYLDKNVLFDHADHVIFGAAGQSPSVSLVEAARAGRIRATVSLDAVKSAYGHLRYRLARPAEEGGRGLSEEDAEARARAFTAETFLSGGAFRIEPAAPEDLAAAAKGGSGLSLEDALEHQVWLRARMGRAAPTLFVTRDRDFERGVHPARVLDQLAASGWPLTPPRGRPV